MLLFPQIVERQIDRCPMQEGAGVYDILRILDAKQSHLSILGQVGRRLAATDDALQSGDQLLLVRVKESFEIER